MHFAILFRGTHFAPPNVQSSFGTSFQRTFLEFYGIMLNYFVTAVVNSSFSTCTLTLNIDLVTEREIFIIRKPRVIMLMFWLQNIVWEIWKLSSVKCVCNGQRETTKCTIWEFGETVIAFYSWERILFKTTTLSWICIEHIHTWWSIINSYGYYC